MLTLPSGLRVYIANQPLDMRKSFQGISALIQAQFNCAANGGHIFVFHNRGFDKIKIFYWDRNGFVQWYKQLEQGRFRFPRLTQKLYEISASDLTLLLEGIDLNYSQRLSAF